MYFDPVWRDGDLNKEGKVELVPTDWVWRYWGSDVSPLTDLGGNKKLDLDGLQESLEKEGLRDPLIMRVGLKDRKMRLESGNHRIQLFHKHKIPLVPVTVQVRSECGPHLDDVMTDATHSFDASSELLINESEEEYMKPSKVFKMIV